MGPARIIRRFLRDIFPWILLVFFFVMGVALAFSIGRELRRSGGRPPAAAAGSDSGESSQ